MLVEYQGKQYEFIRASDVIKDGIWLELYDHTTTEPSQLLAAFWSDTDNSFTFFAYREQLPFEIVETFVKKARELLPPLRNEP